MDRIDHMLAHQHYLPDSQLAVRYENGRAEIRLGAHGSKKGRRQIVHIQCEGDHYVLTSVVLGPARTAQYLKEPSELAELVWRRNRRTDVVNFTFDRQRRLIGRIEHPYETLDPEELYFYLSRLAIECDRMEYVLTGRDVF